MLLDDLPQDFLEFNARFGGDEQCREYLFQARWPDGFRCSSCGHGDAYALRTRLVYECVACGKQHSLLAGTLFEQTKTGLARWFLAIYLVTSSKGGIAAAKTLVAGAVEAGGAEGRRLGRLRLAVVPDASAASLEGFLGAAVATPAAVATDGWGGYAGLPTKGYAHEPVELGGGDAALRLPGIHLVFGLAKRWLLGTHHGAVSRKHLPAYLDEYVFRFNRRTARSISHGFARLVEQD